MDIEDKILHEFTKEMRETYIGFDLACFLVERGKAHFEVVPQGAAKGHQCLPLRKSSVTQPIKN